MTKRAKFEKRLTSSEVILLAAHDLTRQGTIEFTEWQLSVATWQLDPIRFGMRGFENQHPDHKRVMMVIMGQAPTNPIQKGFLEKPRANHYRLTALGRVEATRLAEAGRPGHQGPLAASDLYEAVARYADHRVFQAWLKDPSEPRSWLGASAFLGITKNDPTELNKRLRGAARSVSEGLAWCDEHGRSRLTRGPVGGGRAIRRDEIEKLGEFIAVLQSRFEPQMSAIRRRGDSFG
jgi:hypothetical protein